MSDSVGEVLLPQLVQQAVQNQHVNVEQKIRAAKTRYKRKVEAYAAGLIELDDLTLEKEQMEKEIAEAEKLM